MQTKITHVCTYCPRPEGVDYADYKDSLGVMMEFEYSCPFCGVCRSCGRI